MTKIFSSDFKNEDLQLLMSMDIEDLFNAIKKLVLTIRQKIEGIREEIKEKERKRSATGQFVQMIARQNNLITKSMYK